jgi:hypothetical protein
MIDRVEYPSFGPLFDLLIALEELKEMVRRENCARVKATTPRIA